MRIVFMGTPEFAVPSLRALASEHQVAAVFTRPDSISGRGSACRPTPVRDAATALGLPVLQPANLRDADAIEELRELSPELIVVAAYGLLLPREVLAIPPRGCINVHASLLPRWRGAAPIQWAILEGDEHTGVSIMRMEEGLDTGAYCRKVHVEVAQKGVEELALELAEEGARALRDALRDIQDDRCVWVEQDDSAATYARKITKADLALSPVLEVVQALRRVRASSAQAPARAAIAGRPVTVTDAREARTHVPEGGVLADRDTLVLGLKDGSIEIAGVKPDGKPLMAGADWARGLRLAGTEQWEGI
jgi:methionyl-tRNA formyltransferase